jgi:hypothetical protein
VALLGKPRLLELGEVVARAETLRWRRIVRGYVYRGIFGGAAIILALMAILALHIAIWAVLSGPLGAGFAALGIAALDLIVCLVLGRMALRPPADAVGEQARSVRDVALHGARQELQTFGGVLRIRGTRTPPQTRRVIVSPPRL